VEFARATNKRAAGKTLGVTLVSNLSRMTEETAEWLVANEVAIRTWLDGPAELHDGNRKWTVAGAHADVVRWIEWFDRRYRELGRDPDVWHVDARVTTTRRTLSAWREVVDEYVARGMRSIHLRPLGPLGFDAEAWQTIGYTAEEYVAFYERAFGYIVELNRRGVHLAEATASMFLNKILSSGDPATGEIRSPCLAGTSEVAYDADGRVFPGDEARRVDAFGDPLFALGHVRELTIADVVRHPTVRAIAAASLLDAQPMCADCWNKPFCGISPCRPTSARGTSSGSGRAASSARSTWRSPARSSHCWRTRATARRPGSSNAGRPGPAGIGRWVRRPPTAGSSRGSLRPSFHPVRKTLANRPTDVLTVRGGDVRRQGEHESPLSDAIERRRGAEPCPGSVDPGHRPPSLAGSWPGPAAVASGVAGWGDARERRPACGARRRRPPRCFPARRGRAASPR